MSDRSGLKFAERLKVWDFLKTVCREEGGWAVYDDGWSDQRVVDAVRGIGLSVTVNNIKGLRSEMIGNLRAGGSSTASDLSNRVSDLEARIAYLERYLLTPEERACKVGPDGQRVLPS